MNASQKKKIDKIIGKLELEKAAIDELVETLQATVDAKSDKWRDSENGEQATSEISSLEDVASSLESALDSLASARGELD